MAAYDGEDRSVSDEDEGNPYAEYESAYAGISTIDVVRKMDSIRAAKDDLEDQLKVINREYDFLRLKLIPTRFEEEGIESLKVEGVGRVSLTGDMYVSTIKARTGDFYEWLRDRNKGSLIVETINASTLKAAVKSWMKGGDEVPEEFVKVTPFTRASITKR